VSQSWGLLTSAAVLSCCPSAMAQRIRIMLLALVVIIVLANVSLIVLSVGRPPARPLLPNPNGYDDLLKAGQATTRTTDNPADLDRVGLRALVTTNAEALRLLRLGLTRHCAVPTDATIANFRAISRDLISLRSLATVLSAEGRLAEMENRPADATRSYVDAIRLGTEMSRGGLMINRLVEHSPREAPSETHGRTDATSGRGTGTDRQQHRHVARGAAK
jgi:hypothetical protein